MLHVFLWGRRHRGNNKLLEGGKETSNVKGTTLFHPHRDKTHVDWVKAYLSIWTELQNYIKQHHTTGLTWSKSVSPPIITLKNLRNKSLRVVLTRMI